MVKKFISYFKSYRRLFYSDLLVASISAICDLIYPMMTRTLVNNAIPIAVILCSTGDIYWVSECRQI